MFTIQKATLSNNLRVICTPLKSTEAVTVMVIIKAGSRYETKNINGISHFIEHMFFKGGAKYPTPKAVAEAIDSVGGSFNAFTGKSYVAYYIKLQKDKVEIAFDGLSDMLLHAKFEEEALNRERGVILEEYNMYQDNPASIVGEEFESDLFGDHPIGWTIIGTPQTIKAISRDQMLTYIKKHYTTPNMIVSVAGNITLGETKKLVNKYLPFPASKTKTKAEPFKKFKPGKKLNILSKKTEQAHLVLGLPAFGSEDPRRYAATVLAKVLGGGMSSRLFTSVREELGLAYYVGASYSAYIDTGVLTIRAGVDKSRADLAIATILKELKEISTHPVSKVELKKAQEYIIGHLTLELENSEEIAFSFGVEELLEDKIETPKEYARKIRKVTPQEVLALAKDLFRDNQMTLTIIGAAGASGKIKKIYHLN